MQKEDTILGKKVRTFTEIGVIEADAHMLEHSDGNDAIKRACHVPMVLKIKLDALAHPLSLAAGLHH